MSLLHPSFTAGLSHPAGAQPAAAGATQYDGSSRATLEGITPAVGDSAINISDGTATEIWVCESAGTWSKRRQGGGAGNMLDALGNAPYDNDWQDWLISQFGAEFVWHAEDNGSQDIVDRAGNLDDGDWTTPGAAGGGAFDASGRRHAIPFLNIWTYTPGVSTAKTLILGGYSGDCTWLSLRRAQTAGTNRVYFDIYELGGSNSALHVQNLGATQRLLWDAQTVDFTSAALTGELVAMAVTREADGGGGVDVRAWEVIDDETAWTQLTPAAVSSGSINTTDAADPYADGVTAPAAQTDSEIQNFATESSSSGKNAYMHILFPSALTEAQLDTILEVLVM